MNRPIRRVAVACMLLMFALLLADNWVQVLDAESLRDRPENSRQITERLARERGPIIVDGRGVAQSVPVDDEYKFQRTYPAGPLYAHVTGYYTIFQATGIERSQDDLLSGEDEELFIRRLSDLLTGREPKGGAVSLTLEPAVQQAAAAALAGRRGAVVALDPQTGAVLAMVSSPSFDPNPLADHDGAAATRAFEALEADPAKPLLNRAVQELYPPGSTFKVVTAAAALSSGDYTSETQIPAPQSITLENSTARLPNFGDSSCAGSGRQPLLDALRISCNTAFALLGREVGDDALREQAQAFGFGSPVDGLGLPQAVSTFPEDPDAAQTQLSAIGQFDVRVTPLQMAMVAAAIANGGELMRPYLVAEKLAPDLSVLERTDPEQLAQPVDRNVAAQLSRMMEAVVSSGTGTRARIPGVAVAGKTGSAESVPGQLTHAWFIGFAPVENPQIAVAVIIENGGAGGQVAAPVARQVISAALGTR